MWRDVLGSHLRRARLERGATLQQISERAGISMQYLSEIERGAKDPSSEMIAAVAGALDSDLASITESVSRSLQSASYRALALAA